MLGFDEELEFEFEFESESDNKYRLLEMVFSSTARRCEAR
tara:strand:+ start:526 stop:645 length:120 start_codon:yes stop_codon:yes gene_type:complete